MRRNPAPDCRARVQPRYARCDESAETLTQAQERGEDMGDYGVFAVISSVDRAIAKQPSASRTAGTSFCQPLGTAGCRAQHRTMTMELFTPARDVLAQRTLGWWRVEGGFKE